MKDNKLPRGVTPSLLDAVMKAMEHDSREAKAKAISPKVKAKATPKTDPIGKEDKDINNDGKVNNTDGFLAARRRAIAARVAKMKEGKKMKGNTSPKVAIKGSKKDSVAVNPALGESMTSEQYNSEVQWALRSGLTPPIRPAMFAEAHDDDEGWHAHHEIHGKKGVSAKDWKAGWRMNLKGEIVKKQNEEHTQCGTPDCCGQCDTTQVDETSDGRLTTYIKRAKWRALDPQTLGDRKSLNRQAGIRLAQKKKWGDPKYGTDAARVPATDLKPVNEAAMSDDAHELMIHGDNNSQLYKSSYVPVAKNLEKKWKKGTYDHEKAKKLWKYHADRASDSYKKEHGYGFPPAVRREVAGHYADQHKAEMEAGNMHESLSEARVNQERPDSGAGNVIDQLRKIRPTSPKTIYGSDGSKFDITLAHRNAALAKHAEVMGGKGPGSYGSDKQAFITMLGSNEKGFHAALAGNHTKRSTIAGYEVPRKHIDEVITAKTPTSDVISDFVHSKNPKFADKSKAKRIQMALAASYAKKRGD